MLAHYPLCLPARNGSCVRESLPTNILLRREKLQDEEYMRHIR